jgi:GTP-dependent phosphoenolpyruvate carboxykinase
MGAQDNARDQARAALRSFLRSSTESSKRPSARLVARPRVASRLQTTGQRLQRGRDLQQRLRGFTMRFFFFATPEKCSDS